MAAAAAAKGGTIVSTAAGKTNTAARRSHDKSSAASAGKPAATAVISACLPRTAVRAACAAAICAVLPGETGYRPVIEIKGAENGAATAACNGEKGVDAARAIRLKYERSAAAAAAICARSVAALTTDDDLQHGACLEINIPSDQNTQAAAIAALGTGGGEIIRAGCGDGDDLNGTGEGKIGHGDCLNVNDMETLLTHLNKASSNKTETKQLICLIFREKHR
jgi:hypothetical protein